MVFAGKRSNIFYYSFPEEANIGQGLTIFLIKEVKL